jgi:hypothetical protein
LVALLAAVAVAGAAWAANVLTRPQFIGKADRICATANAQVSLLYAEKLSLAKTLQLQNRIARAADAAMAALKPPPSEQPLLRDFLSLSRRLERLNSQLASHPGSASIIAQEAALTTKQNAVATRMGAHTCAQNP